MSVERDPGGDQNFGPSGEANLYAYPNTISPTLLFWCTATSLPTEPFSIAQAWTQQGYFLFVSDPSQNLNNFSGVSTAMTGVDNPPAANSSGFAWLDMAGDAPSLQTVQVQPTSSAAGTVASDVTLGASTGVPALLLKAGAPVFLQPDGQSFAFLYPAGIPNTDSPQQTAPYPIVLALLGPAARQFQFTGFAPRDGYYYQYNVVIDPLGAGNNTETSVMFAIELVPTGQPFPAFAIQIPPQ